MTKRNLGKALQGYRGALTDMEVSNMSDQKVICEQEAAIYLGISQSSLKKARLAGQKNTSEFPPFLRFGRSIRYRVGDLEQWMDRLVRACGWKPIEQNAVDNNSKITGSKP